MNARTAGGLCILVTVYHPYRWVAPFLARTLDERWENHPPIFFCGLTGDEADGLPVLPLRDATLPRAWAAFTHDAVEELRGRGYSKCYLVLEEHLPLGVCHAAHLNSTLPALLDELDAAYIGLMGWDNRRYTTRAPVLGPAQNRLMHLNTVQAPRFHLSPSLWRLDALRDCLSLTVRGGTPTPLSFEKTLERYDADLPERWKRGCYQICGAALAAKPSTRAQALGRRIERSIFHRLMALHHLIPDGPFAQEVWRRVGFDDFVCQGPYPMFFSGIMAKGRLNPHFLRFMQRHPENGPLLAALLAAKAASDEAFPS